MNKEREFLDRLNGLALGDAPRSLTDDFRGRALELLPQYIKNHDGWVIYPHSFVSEHLNAFFDLPSARLMGELESFYDDIEDTSRLFHEIEVAYDRVMRVYENQIKTSKDTACKYIKPVWLDICNKALSNMGGDFIIAIKHFEGAHLVPSPSKYSGQMILNSQETHDTLNNVKSYFEGISAKKVFRDLPGWISSFFDVPPWNVFEDLIYSTHPKAAEILLEYARLYKRPTEWLIDELTKIGADISGGGGGGFWLLTNKIMQKHEYVNS